MPGPVRQAVTYIVTYIVTGTPGAQVTCGPAGINLTGSVPMDVTTKLGDPSYYAINAQHTMPIDDLGELHAELIGATRTHRPDPTSESCQNALVPHTCQRRGSSAFRLISRS